MPKHRIKRGFINIKGQTYNFLYGTMDDKDRIDTEYHLNIKSDGLHNSITALNQQIKKNNNFNQTFITLKDTISKDRHKMLNQLYGLECT